MYTGGIGKLFPTLCGHCYAPGGEGVSDQHISLTYLPTTLPTAIMLTPSAPVISSYQSITLCTYTGGPCPPPPSWRVLSISHCPCCPDLAIWVSLYPEFGLAQCSRVVVWFPSRIMLRSVAGRRYTLPTVPEP